VILNKDLITDNLDPPHDYGESDGNDGDSKTPVIALRPYEEVTTDDNWSTDPKVFGGALQAAVDAHKSHAEGAGLLKAQCSSKLCNFPND